MIGSQIEGCAAHLSRRCVTVTIHRYAMPLERYGPERAPSRIYLDNTSRTVRTFGQLPDIHFSDDFGEPLPDAEIVPWEADSTD